MERQLKWTTHEGSDFVLVCVDEVVVSDEENPTRARERKREKCRLRPVIEISENSNSRAEAATPKSGELIDPEHLDVFDRATVRLAPFFQFDSLNVLESDTCREQRESEYKLRFGSGCVIGLTSVDRTIENGISDLHAAAHRDIIGSSILLEEFVPLEKFVDLNLAKVSDVPNSLTSKRSKVRSDGSSLTRETSFEVNDAGDWFIHQSTD